MEIKTKFDITQEVYYPVKRIGVLKGEVLKIVIDIFGVFYTIDFPIIDVTVVKEKDLFATEEEAKQKFKEIENEQSISV